MGGGNGIDLVAVREGAAELVGEIAQSDSR